MTGLERMVQHTPRRTEGAMGTSSAPRPQKATSDRYFSIQQAAALLNAADLAKEQKLLADKRKSLGQRVDEVMAESGVQASEEMSLTNLYALAQRQGIEPEYLDEQIRLYNPSKEVVKASIEDHNLTQAGFQYSRNYEKGREIIRDYNRLVEEMVSRREGATIERSLLGRVINLLNRGKSDSFSIYLTDPNLNDGKKTELAKFDMWASGSNGLRGFVDGRVVMTNPVFLTMFGDDFKEINKKSCFQDEHQNLTLRLEKSHAFY